MFANIEEYLVFKGTKYIKPEKAGILQKEMEGLRSLAQAARKEFELLAKELERQVSPFHMEKVSQWMNQSQICRPHFWVYYRLPSDLPEDVGIALRLYGSKENFGVSVEVSFVERKKSPVTLKKQQQVLEYPVQEGIYYVVQEGEAFRRVEATEENRIFLQEQLLQGTIRKVLIKEDIPLERTSSISDRVLKIKAVFHRILPYYEQTKKRISN